MRWSSPLAATTRPPGLYDPDLLDRIAPVPTDRAHEMARKLSHEEGLMVGVSAAAATAAALDVAKSLDRGTIVVLHPDSAMKYLNEPFWEE